MGFDRVFPPDVDLKQVAELLRQDIKEKFGSCSKGQEAEVRANQTSPKNQSQPANQISQNNNNRKEPERF